MPNDKELGYYRIDPSEAKATAARTPGEEAVRKILELFGTNNPESTFSPAADFSLQEPANSILAKIVNKVINSRNEVYHATYPTRMLKALSEGQFKPSMTEGVSTSRVPNVRTFETPLRVVLDEAKMPPTTPIAESAWQKTHFPSNYDFNKGAPLPMNPNFEFENRTQGPLPLQGTIKKFLALKTQPLYQDEAATLSKTAPIEYYNNTNELNTYRAKRAWDEYMKTRNSSLVENARDVIHDLKFQLGEYTK